MIQGSAGEGFIVLLTATVRHRVDPSNVFLKVLRYWEIVYICKQVCVCVYVGLAQLESFRASLICPSEVGAS